ncbi:MAG: bifunctional phosphoribosylaminoimidazolecarboxamide formyltransferase/IMP cyclohydrolase [Candidatus Omnitrophica bacterium]|nr:bifunctional phosphoribosylaminoimidazolecarboxamide formyltransferase/IMP cyclohydrolase [Candidatus Omnitrophota bacterium]
MSTNKIKRALISVSDKTGLIPFAQELSKYNIQMISTGGTLKALKEAGLDVTAIDQVTGFPEILDGRVKTLHPKVHGGLLYRRDKTSHQKQAQKHGIKSIDLVVVNLYPFEQVTSKKSVKFEEAIENIDIGGPSMLRSAAKNFDSVTVVCDPSDYAHVVDDLHKHKGSTSQALRFELACKVFERTSIYDGVISSFLKSKQKKKTAKELPQRLNLMYQKVTDLRYGENPHQRAALYTPSGHGARLTFKQLHGKELSFNNFLDMEATVDILREFKQPAACVVKHTNPCGVAQDKNITRALEFAVESDPLSAFGGIVGLNRRCDVKTARKAFAKLGFFEVLVAPAFDQAALKVLTQRKNLRLIETGSLKEGGPYDLRILKSGMLLQDRDRPIASGITGLKKSVRFVTRKKLSAKELDNLLFAWTCAKTVKSNAIVLTQGAKTVGIGAGQMSRVDSVFIACQKAGKRTKGSYLGSDAFFPMPDAIEEAARHKIKAIIQPGGSIRDKDVIAACNRFGIAMAFTGKRHFRH